MLAPRIILACSAIAAALVITGCSSSPPPVSKPQEESPAADTASETVAADSAPEPSSDENAPETPAPEKHKYTNRLSRETSPYLKAHGHNPVDWYPWGQDALDKAKKEGKLIFLSVGYASCHWCHVMERETFENEEIAAFLNANYVCIKVDREERPEVDHLYMTALHVFNQMAGRGSGGGWPLSMFLTPDAKPFYGTTYLPPADGDRGVKTGFYTLVQVLLNFHKEHREQLVNDAERLTVSTRQAVKGIRASSLTEVDAQTMADARRTYARQFDDQYGGFGYSATNPQLPKFPEPSNLLFLIKYAQQNGDERASEMAIKTLEKMAQGGIYDHLAGGFHRYSVDRFWRIPHFEKMLYDNGQLASTYAAAYEKKPREDFRRVIQGTCDFVLREMRDKEGAFYSSLDAETEDEEGAFYRWTKAQLQEALTPEEFKLLATAYGVGDEPNFERQYYVPQLGAPLSEIAKDQGIQEAALVKKVQPILSKLRNVRSQREQPRIDTKILTSWNGLMIAGLADAGRVLQREDYVQAAEEAATFILENMRMKDGRLLRTFSGGYGKLNGYLTDYAFLVDGLLALYEATDDKKWLDTAEELTELQLKLFLDKENKGFFFTTEDHESMFARAKRQSDNVEPAGNSVAAGNLLHLSELLDRQDFRDAGRDAIQSTAYLLYKSPTSAPRILLAVMEHPVKDTSDSETPDAEEAPGDVPPEPE